MENAAGINFNFLTETTFSRTALVVIDYGDGDFEQYRVATNVDRDPATAAFTGITMGRVMQDILELDYEVGTNGVAGAPGARQPQLRAITRGDGQRFAYVPTQPGFLPEARWIVFASASVDLVDANSNAIAFEDIRLRNRDEIRLVFDRDQDGDGIYARKEFLYGTIDRPEDLNGDNVIDASEYQRAIDTDGDGIDDPVEMDGWRVTAATLPDHGDYPKRVFPNPTTADTDADGLSDLDEMLGADGVAPGETGDSDDATDPTNPDTDGDGLLDGVDAYPTVPAVTLHVDAHATTSGTGLNWLSPMETLREALAFAAEANDPDHPDFDPTQVVSEIWVADGVYMPSGAPAQANRADTFRLFNNVGIYGGFEGADSTTYPGGETRRLQRNPDPLTNGAILEGDIEANGAAGNSYTVVTSDLDPATGDPIDASAILDGFTITGGRADVGFASDPQVSHDAETCGGGLYNAVGAAPTLRNLFFSDNTARSEGGGMVDYGSAVLEKCTFNANSADTTNPRQEDNYRGGGGLASVNASTTLTDCVFSANAAIAGGGLGIWNGAVRAERCTFTGNSAAAVGDSNNNMGQGGDGGGLYIERGTHRFINCAFRSNSASDGSIPNYGFRRDLFAGGGGAYVALARVAMTNCAFWNNRTDWNGGGMHVRSNVVTLTNCTFARNEARKPNNQSFDSSGGGFYQGFGAPVVNVRNAIFWGNAAAENPTRNLYRHDNQAGGGGELFVDNTLIEGLSVGQAALGAGNIDGDPSFIAPDGGNLRLRSNSVAIDLGNTLLDIDPFTTGSQALPAFDLAGKPRVTAGIAGGNAVVDLGAYEYQGQ